VKGAVPGIYDPDPEETARVDLQVILQTILEAPGLKVTQPKPQGRYTHLRVYADKAQHPTWTDITQSFEETTAELRVARLLRMLSCGNLFNSFQIAYLGILWKDLSIDLVAASLRQREFASKITGENCGIDAPSALLSATTRYHNFLLLMKRKPKENKVSLVPTLDIDLCWHTHQLDAVSYRQ